MLDLQIERDLSVYHACVIREKHTACTLMFHPCYLDDVAECERCQKQRAAHDGDRGPRGRLRAETRCSMEHEEDEVPLLRNRETSADGSAAAGGRASGGHVMQTVARIWFHPLSPPHISFERWIPFSLTIEGAPSSRVTRAGRLSTSCRCCCCPDPGMS